MDTEKICRCCLALDVPLLSIYDGGSAGMGCVADMLKQIAKINPQPADKMPEKACVQCISEINRCYVFKMKCENSNRTLRQLLPQAVPESSDFVLKKVVSTGVQTDEKIIVSALVQTVDEEKPIVCRSSVQTEEEVKQVKNSNKKIQSKREVYRNIENIFIYEDMANADGKAQKRKHNSPERTQMNKNLSLEDSKTNNFIATEESESDSGVLQQPSAYILLEDSNCSEGPVVYTSSEIKSSKYSECDRYEYYENEVEEIQDDENECFTYQENDYSRENLKLRTVYDIESSEAKTKSDEEAEALIKPRKYNKNKPKGQYKCSQCIMTFVSMKVLKRHLANRHDIKDAEILIDYLPPVDTGEMSKDVDGSSSNNTAKLYNSIAELTAENVAKPQLMPRERTTSIINEDFLTDVKYFCNNCQAGFAQRKTLTIHMKHRVCMTNNFKCNVCEGIFVSEKNLETHKLTHENPHKCLECDTVCKTIEELSQHMIKNHNRSARNQCHICKKVFTMKTSLIDHLRIHSGEKPFLCTICGKSFRQNSNLRQHLIRHTNEKNFKCDMCPNAYVTKAELFSHKRTHTGDHPFKCEICQARFTTSCSLKKHLRKHTGERPYACEFCPMRFAALNVLKNHRRIHTGEKPYKCVHCPKTFTQKGDCLMHERTHINNDFKCFCDTKFSKKSNLTYHIKTQHPGYNEKEIQEFLDKSVGDNDDGDGEYEITLMESTIKNYENENEAFVPESEEKQSAHNEEIMEIVMEDVG